MYAQVVVLTYQPPNIPSYTYKIPKELEKEIKVGQLVLVPFGKRTPMGAAVKITEEKVREVGKVREIRGIVLKEPLLLPYQLKLLDWMAFYYQAPMVNCLEAMLPQIPRRLGRFGELGILGKEQQTLVLVPSINRLPETLAKYPNAKNHIIYHNELISSERFHAWGKILNGDIDYIFGSRSAIFAPCPNIGKIIIYDEHDGAYKDERSPYFDTLTVAEKLQELTGVKLELVDSAPKITTYFNFANSSTPASRSRRHLDYTESNSVSRVGRDTPRVSLGKVTNVQVVSMLAEKAAGNKSPISGLLENYIELGFKRNKKILLFLNKKNDSGHIYCKNCQFSDFAPSAPESCPNCKSADIWFNAVNVTTLAALVKQIVPDANVNIIAERLRAPNDIHLRGVKAHLGSGKNGKIDIGTAAALYKLSPTKYDLVTHVRTDSILNISDFSSTERLFWQIADLKKLTRGLLLLQTYNPDHPVIKYTTGANYQKFFAEQISERKTLSYPPFALLIKLTAKGKSDQKLEPKAQQLYEELNRSTARPAKPRIQPRGRSGANSLPAKALSEVEGASEDQPPTVIILGPYKSFFTKPLIKYNIILKIPTKNYNLATREKAIKKMQPLLASVPRDWQIEVEPDSLN